MSRAALLLGVKTLLDQHKVLSVSPKRISLLAEAYSPNGMRRGTNSANVTAVQIVRICWLGPIYGEDTDGLLTNCVFGVVKGKGFP